MILARSIEGFRFQVSGFKLAKPEGSKQKAEGRDQRSENRGQRTEVGGGGGVVLPPLVSAKSRFILTIRPSQPAESACL